MDLCISGQGPVARSCKHDDEPLDCVKGGAVELRIRKASGADLGPQTGYSV
jgi:hypothetical protein